MKRWIVIVCVALAVLAAGAAGAYFTGQAQVPDNTVTAGKVVISTEPTSAAIVVGALAPGTETTQPLTMVNDGSLPVACIVTAAKKAGITAFYEALTCRVSTGGAVIYDGPLATLKTAPVSMAAGSRSRLEFAIGLPATAGNDLMGDSAKFTLYVDAEQVR